MPLPVVAEVNDLIHALIERICGFTIPFLEFSIDFGLCRSCDHHAIIQFSRFSLANIRKQVIQVQSMNLVFILFVKS